MTEPLQPVAQIVDKEGSPTPYFLRWIQTLTQSVDGLINTPSTAGLVLINQQSVSTAIATLNLDAIDSTYSDLVLSIHGRGDTAALTATVLLRFNGDAGGNYYSDRVTRLASVQVTAGTSAQAGTLPAATTTAGRAGAVNLTIPDYTSFTLDKEFSFTNYYNSGAVPTAQYGGGHWESLSPVTSITLTLSAGNFDVGTVVSLYGRN